MLNQHQARIGAWWSPSRMDYEFKPLFAGLPLLGSSVLEIGAGDGILSAWCAANGAGRVVAIEPESDGATVGVQAKFHATAGAVPGLGDLVTYKPLTFDQYADEVGRDSFNFVVMRDVINHLDEEATAVLHKHGGEDARKKFVDILQRIADFVAPGGYVLVTDVGRLNFWNAIGMKSPFAPTIEWHKHQQPSMWQSLLERVGFEKVDERWPVRFKMRALGPLLSWKLPSYFLGSHFAMRMRKKT
jgi:SAM-dependent methyltransferase